VADATDECFAALPPAVHSLTLKLVMEFTRRDYYDDRHAHILDGRTLEERRDFYRQMQPHYRQVGERLFCRLRSGGLA
jgi:hypothetical protein